MYILGHLLRLKKICDTSFNKNVRLFIDAEESWIQEAIDNIESDEDEIIELYEAVEKGFLSKWIPMLPKNPDRQVKGSEYHPNQSLFN